MIECFVCCVILCSNLGLFCSQWNYLNAIKLKNNLICNNYKNVQLLLVMLYLVGHYHNYLMS